MALLNFNATQVEPSSGSMDPIPAGWYNVMIDQSEMKPTKDKAGAYLELRFTVIDGKYANRKVFSRLNLLNSNPQAQQIAYQDLSAICHATGRINVGDSQELHGIPMKIRVKLRPAEGEYEAGNEINAYKNINHVVEGAAPAGAPAGGFQPPAQATMATPAFAAPAFAAPAFAAPAAAPAQPAPAFAAPAPAPQAAPAWTPPAAEQPWAAVPTQAAPAPAPAAVPAPAAAGFPGATPPWMTPGAPA